MRSDEVAELLSLLDSLPEPRIVMSKDYRVIAANAAYKREFACGDDVVGRYCYEVSHHFFVPCDQAGESCPLKNSLESGQIQRVLHLHHTPRGEEHVAVDTTPIFDRKGAVVCFVETMRVVRQASSRPAAQGMVGRSRPFKAMLAKILRVADTEAAVVLLGETGTGKELVAHAIHEASSRASAPFVAVDCAGMTETLFEAELFGYEKGAFTGALHRKLGLVEAAAGGTLFLDEIGELPLSLQVKLLRLLETGTYRRVGGVDWLPVDFRLISATHRNLEQMVKDGAFREDLYFRINTFPIRTPSLRERPEDIPLLAMSLLHRVDRKGGRSLSDESLIWLSRRQLSGNVRELRNLIERASIMADGSVIDPEHFDEVPSGEIEGGGATVFRLEADAPVDLASLEKRYIAWLRETCGLSSNDMAEILGVSRRTLYRKLAGLGK